MTLYYATLTLSLTFAFILLHGEVTYKTTYSDTIQFNRRQCFCIPFCQSPTFRRICSNWNAIVVYKLILTCTPIYVGQIKEFRFRIAIHVIVSHASDICVGYGFGTLAGYTVAGFSLLFHLDWMKCSSFVSLI